MEASHQQVEEQLKRILTPTQQAKFVLGLRERGRRMMERWKAHRMNREGQGKDSLPEGSGAETDSNSEK